MLPNHTLCRPYGMMPSKHSCQLSTATDAQPMPAIDAFRQDSRLPNDWPTLTEEWHQLAVAKGLLPPDPSLHLISPRR